MFYERNNKMLNLLNNLSAPAKEELAKYKNYNAAVVTGYSSLRTPEENKEKYTELIHAAHEQYFLILFINAYDKQDTEFKNSLYSAILTIFDDSSDNGKTLGFARKQTKILESPSFLFKHFKAKDFTETDNQEYAGVKYNCANKIIRLTTATSFYNKGKSW